MIRALALFSAGVACAGALTAGEAAITAAGVIGNTGGQGAALIHQTTDFAWRGHGNQVGCGLALDRRGALWTRMDDSAVSRLSLDGRQLARFTAPRSNSGYDTISLLGDQVLLLANGELLGLPVEAAPGSAFAPLGAKLRALAHTPVAGRMAAITAEGAVVWVAGDGRSEEVARLPDAWIIEADGGGALYVGTRSQATFDDGTMHKLVAGKEVSGGGWPKPWAIVRAGVAMTANFLRWDDGGFFSGGSGNVSHYTADLEPSPGTVLGMQGAYVIGVGADWRQELGVARGIVRVRPGLYAVGGAWGQPFFATWPDMTRSMHLVAWFTARPECQALNIDAEGTVFADRLVYAWDATPDSFPVQGEGSDLASQIVRAGPSLMVRQDRWAHGADDWALPLHSGARMQNTDWLNRDKVDRPGWWDRAEQGPTRVFPAVAYAEGDGLTFLCLADASGARSLRLASNGRLVGVGGPVAFRTATPGKELTTLALGDAHTLLGAIDGQVVEFAPDGKDWRERRRWSSWGAGPDERFGARIRIACDRGRLLVSDQERNRVLWFAASGGKPRAAFGAASGGSDLRSLAAPGLIAICGDRAVVHDGGNQRLVKLVLSE